MTGTGYLKSAIDKMFGTVSIDSFANTSSELDGTHDDTLLGRALTAVKADTYPRGIIFPDRAFSFVNTYPLDHDGLKFIGGCRMEREFRETNRIKCPAGGLFQRGSGTRDFLMEGLAFEASGSGVWMQSFATDNSAGRVEDMDVSNCGFQGFSSILSGTVLRFDINRVYINGATNTQLNVGGSDNDFFMYGRCYASGTLPSNKPWFDFGVSSSNIKLGYVTPQTGYAARFNYTQGGVVVFGGKSDCTGRSGSLATQQAGILQNIPSGRSITYHDIWVFNAGQNGSSAGSSKGLIMITGGDANFYSPNFPGTMTGTTPAVGSIPGIYVGAGCKARVYGPVAENGGYKHLRAATATSQIYCDDPTWAINVAA